MKRGTHRGDVSVNSDVSAKSAGLGQDGGWSGERGDHAVQAIDPSIHRHRSNPRRANQNVSPSDGRGSTHLRAVDRHGCGRAVKLPNARTPRRCPPPASAERYEDGKCNQQWQPKKVLNHVLWAQVWAASRMEAFRLVSSIRSAGERGFRIRDRFRVPKPDPDISSHADVAQVVRARDS